MDEENMQLAVTTWALYGVGVCLIIVRIVSRLLTLRSLAKLQLDDWLMIIVVAPFTGIVICANFTLPIHASERTNEIEIVRSLKMRFTLEVLQITTNWLVKACLLILYWRIFPASTNKIQRRYFFCIAILCLISFIAIQGLLPVWCRPMHHYWNTTPIKLQCATYRNHSITTLALGTFTTLALLLLPVPHIPTPRTFLLFTLLFLGTIGCITGVLGRYYVIKNHSSSKYLLWYVAETTTLIAYANMPFLSSLLSSSGASYRYVSQNSLSQWPRSYKDGPLKWGARQRLGSEVEEGEVREMSRAQRHHEGSVDEHRISVSKNDDEDGAECSVAVPQVVVRKLSLTSPPPELEAYWTARRVSVRGVKLGEGVQEVRVNR
ncbi:unnamed protein product [Periconia digitata]|uniref:Rhodopsin domain-containing protein n=1 Tax=Periconia digitata TaxID=1303443 RepID=A0A9W4XRR9_9PLEO|nr:unnamed protein product [Periconia digitata]